MHHLSANSSISLTLLYTDSNGQSFKYEGTGKINANSLTNPDLPRHQIYLYGINFPDSGISNATFRIQPQYNVIYLSCNQLSDSSAQPIANIDIRLNTDEAPIVYSPISSDFIGTDIARLDSIPKTTSQLTNDSGYITDSSLTDYLQTNTFKPVNWTWTVSTVASGPATHTIAFKDKVITRPDLPNPTEDDDCQLVLDRYWSDSDQHNTFTATPSSIKLKADDTKGELFLSSNSIDLEQEALADKEACEIHFYGDRMHLGTILSSGGKDIKYADIVTKDQLPTLPTNYVTTDTVQTITGDKIFANIKASSFVTTGTNPNVSITSGNILLKTSDNDRTTLTGTDITLTNTAHDVKFGAERLVIDEDTDNQYILAYKDIAKVSQIPTKTSLLTNDSGFITSSALTGYATTSDVSTAVSTAISGQTKETWTFTLADGSTVTKSVVLG